MDSQQWTDLARRFEACDLTVGEWTHEAHLAVGAWMVAHCEWEEAGQRMREGICRLNVSLGGQNTEDAGFHETLTEFWLRVIAAQWRAGRSLDDILRLPAGLWREFYSTELPKDRLARREWRAPDLKPIEA